MILGNTVFYPLKGDSSLKIMEALTLSVFYSLHHPLLFLSNKKGI